MLVALLNVVLPVALVAAVGGALGRFVRVDQGTVARIGLYALSPALALDTLLHTTVSSGAAGRVLLGYVLTVALMGAAAALVASRQPGRTRRSVVAAVMIGNNGNFGLPISLFALGQAGFQYSLIVFLASVVLTFTVGPALYGGGGLASSLRAVARLPILWCVLLAGALRALHVSLPVGLDRGVHLLSQATLPMVLLALGLQVGTGGWPRVTWPVVAASTLRLALGPVVAALVALGVGARGVEWQALVLSAAMPTAVNAYLLATEFEADVETVASTVVVTTLGALASIAVVVTLLGTHP
ncbi:AEC family transporter [Deinococcus pimensis]|uniref:AEC family transporter n=1 Tax=Deinococcus pimensis TaxID=309888 RepID=UPI000484412E|nr:AEC family transporter [Deinococcus pimensis]